MALHHSTTSPSISTARSNGCLLAASMEFAKSWVIFRGHNTNYQVIFRGHNTNYPSTFNLSSQCQAWAEENGTDLFPHPQSYDLIIRQPGILPDLLIWFTISYHLNGNFNISFFNRLFNIPSISNPPYWFFRVFPLRTLEFIMETHQLEQALY